MSEKNNSKKRIGVDIGGTSIKGALFDGEEIVAEHSAATNASGGREAILKSLYAVLDELTSGGGNFIGISSAGNIDPATGICVYATENLPGWTGIHLAEEVSSRYGVPCKADNDAICALKGELRFYPDLHNVTMLTFGTGVGGASLVNGEILRGKNFDAGRWGHVSLYPNGRACSCGRRGCAEAYLSASAVLAHTRRKLDVENGEELFRLYAQGVKEAMGSVMAFASDLNLFLSMVRTVLSPELILLGGGLMNARETLGKLLRDTSDVAFARLGNRAGIYGAAFGL